MKNSIIKTLLEAQKQAGLKNSFVQDKLGWDAAKWHRIVKGKQSITIDEIESWAKVIGFNIVYLLEPI